MSDLKVGIAADVLGQLVEQQSPDVAGRRNAVLAQMAKLSDIYTTLRANHAKNGHALVCPLGGVTVQVRPNHECSDVLVSREGGTEHRPAWVYLRHLGDFVDAHEREHAPGGVEVYVPGFRTLANLIAKVAREG